MKTLSYVGALCVVGFFIYLIFSEKNESRKFEFTYTVSLEASNEPVQVWIPIPKSNEVQTIKNLSLNYEKLECDLEIEQKHQNQYYYCYPKKISF